MKRKLAKGLKRIFALFVSALCLLTVSGLNDCICIANAENQSFSIPFTIEERNGVEVNEFFFRRGVAIEKGKIFSTENICLSHNGEPIISDAEVLQRYDDGSVHWLLISGVVDIAAYEKKILYITKLSNAATGTTFTENSQGISVKGRSIGFSVNNEGINSLTYNQKEQLVNGAIRIYATVDGKTSYMTADEFEVLKYTDAYVKIKVKGKLNEHISGEMYVTLAENTSKLQIDHRITVAEDVIIESTGLSLGVDTSAAEKGLVARDYLDLGKMQLATFDITRFNATAAEKNKNGYIVESDRVIYAPVINEEKFTYFDGMSRTAHLHIGFEENAENWAKTLALVPKVTVDCEQYVKAGEILTTNTGALVDTAIESFKEEWKCGFGNFNIGAMNGYNRETESSGGIGVSLPGEVEYNFGIAYMQTGDEEIFRKMYDASELRADTMVYRGKHEECYGVMRARNWSKYGQGLPFFQSHGYYSDEGGLYMTYLLSGDEYIYDSFKLCMEKTLADMYAREALGGTHTPEYWYWGDFLSEEGDAPFKAAFYESRGMIRARTLYLASRLFEDERYKQAAYDVIKWAELAQLKTGAYNQAMYHNGNYLYQSGQTQMPVKDYVMLMGFRGISQILDWEDNESARKLTLNVADYLCSQGEKFGPILKHPNSDKSVYETNEDGTRGASTETNIMAIDVLCTAYEKTGNEKYLTWILKFLDAYIASSVGGFGGGMTEQGYPGNRGWGSDNIRLTSLLRTSDNLNVIFKENRDVIIEKGYEHIYKIFSEDTVWIENAIVSKEVSFPYAIYNTYESNGKKIAYMFNQYVDVAKDDESWAQSLRILYNDNELWTNCTNIVNTHTSVTIENYLESRQYSVSEQIPVYVDEIQGSARIIVNEFKEEKIDLMLSGEFTASVSFIADEIPVSGKNGYTVNVYSSDGTHIVITPGGPISAENGIISVKVDGKGNRIEKIVPVFDENFESYSVGAFSSSNFSLTRGTSVVGNTLGKYLLLRDSDTSDGITSRLVRDFNGQPGEQFIITLDFMIPEGGTTDAEIFGVQWWDGKGWGAHLRIFGRDLYAGYADYSSRTEMVMEDLKEGKWYNAFVVVDCREEIPTYQFHIGKVSGSKQSFEYSREQARAIIRQTNRDQSTIVSRAISVTERAGANLYVDNIRLVSPKYLSVGFAIARAESIMKNEMQGIKIGQIPGTAFEILEAVILQVESEITGKELTEEEKQIYVQRINNAVDVFINSRIKN